jgi:CubicO group peptidase (beta-lactamase class C family)
MLPDSGAERPDASVCETFVGAGTFYEENPTFVDPHDDGALWTLSTPAAEGLDADHLESAAAELAADPSTWSFLVVRHGKLVFERYFHGSDARASNNVHSASKSMLSVALGIALERGDIASLDQPLAELLPASFAAIDDPAKNAITVRHLAGMTAGLQWSEDQTEYEIEDEPDWVNAILALPLAAVPGQQFEYSTGMTHLLSAALTEATGTSTCDYVHRHLFHALGITAERWGRDPSGIFSGGYNVYLTARELARFGLFVLQDGSWNGGQIVPAAWLTLATSEQISAGEGYGYGLGFWTRTLSDHPIVIVWGFGGQYAYVVPDLDLVVTMTTNTADFSAELDGERILADHVLPFAR